MRHFIALILFLSMTSNLAAEGSKLLRFVCQDYTDYSATGKPNNRVAIVEQLSTKSIDGDEVIDASDLIDPQGRVYTGQTESRMRIYNGVSLISDDRTKEEIIEELLKQEASRDINDVLLDFKGVGSRLQSTFAFEGETPYDKTLHVRLNDLSEGSMFTDSAARVMYEDGSYRCEEPVLIPVE